jgi:uncharacterized protein (DUF433 family)
VEIPRAVQPRDVSVQVPSEVSLCSDTPEWFGVRNHRRAATMTVYDRIELSPKVLLGKPVIRGTRIPVELIVRKLAEGAGEEALIQAYPKLTAADIRAAVRYAAVLPRFGTTV